MKRLTVALFAALALAGPARADFSAVLPTPIPVTLGGTGCTAPTTACANAIGAAGLGANSDITSLTGLTTPLPASSLPIATTSALGAIKPDGTTITVNPSTGVATAVGGGGGGGAVTSVGTGFGLTGGPITTAGTISVSTAINAQTGTSYTIATADTWKLITFSNASAVAVTLPQAGTTGFGAGAFGFYAENLGAGTVTITPTTSTVNGAATLVLKQNTGCTVHSDGTNYQVSGCSAIIPPASFGAAASGANSDITSLSGITTPLPVSEGGTGSAFSNTARSNLGAAAAGANSDITSLSALTTPITLAEGGTGSSTASAARTVLGAAASGANSDITSLGPVSYITPGTLGTLTSGEILFGDNLAGAFASTNVGTFSITAASGLSISGHGSSSDVCLRNSGQTCVVNVSSVNPGLSLYAPAITGNFGLMMTGLYVLAGNSGPPAFSASAEGASWVDTTLGLVDGGQGSTNDRTFQNSANAVWLKLPTGTVNPNFPGGIAVSGTALPTQAAGTLGLGGESSAPTLGANGEGDVYLTSTTGGLTLIGKGSVNDIELLNDAGSIAANLPTGTQAWNFTGLDTHAIGVTLLSHAATTTNGTIWYDSTQNTLGSYENGNVAFKSGVIYSAKASVTTSGTSASTLLSASFVGPGLTLPANFLVPGKTLRYTVFGTVTTTSSPGTVLLTVSLGGTTMASSSASAVTAGTTNAAVAISGLITCQTAGSSGSVTTAGTGFIAGSITFGQTSASATTINTTTAETLNITSTNSVSGGAVLTITNAIVEVLG